MARVVAEPVAAPLSPSREYPADGSQLGDFRADSANPDKCPAMAASRSSDRVQVAECGGGTGMPATRHELACRGGLRGRPSEASAPQIVEMDLRTAQVPTGLPGCAQGMPAVPSALDSGPEAGTTGEIKTSHQRSAPPASGRPRPLLVFSLRDCPSSNPLSGYPLGALTNREIPAVERPTGVPCLVLLNARSGPAHFSSQGPQSNVRQKPQALGRTRVLVAVGFGAAMAIPIVTTIVAPAASAAGGCATKLALIKGNPVEISCGPASAKLHHKGKTYSFKAGTCRVEQQRRAKGRHPLSR